MKQLTWENQTATFNGRIIGYIITVLSGEKYTMVFFDSENKPEESTATTEVKAREWVEQKFNR